MGFGGFRATGDGIWGNIDIMVQKVRILMLTIAKQALNVAPCTWAENRDGPKLWNQLMNRSTHFSQSYLGGKVNALNLFIKL